jgi:hypothetical protein
MANVLATAFGTSSSNATLPGKFTLCYDFNETGYFFPVLPGKLALNLTMMILFFPHYPVKFKVSNDFKVNNDFNDN